jgi:hypothetical protein
LQVANHYTQEMNAQYSPLVSKCVLNTFNLQPFDYGIISCSVKDVKS